MPYRGQSRVASSEHDVTAHIGQTVIRHGWRPASAKVAGRFGASTMQHAAAFVFLHFVDHIFRRRQFAPARQRQALDGGVEIETQSVARRDFDEGDFGRLRRQTSMSACASFLSSSRASNSVDAARPPTSAHAHTTQQRRRSTCAAHSPARSRAPSAHASTGKQRQDVQRQPRARDHEHDQRQAETPASASGTRPTCAIAFSACADSSTRSTPRSAATATCRPAASADKS